MDEASDKYDGPTLDVAFDSKADGTYGWRLRMAAKDHRGSRLLGYKAEGKILSGLIANFDLLVHDEHRNVWTTMPADHRKDIRGLVASTVATAVQLVAAIEK